jgi:hypothetical protein
MSLHEFAERGEPFRKALPLEMVDPTVVFLGGAVERCPPFDEMAPSTIGATRIVAT